MKPIPNFDKITIPSNEDCFPKLKPGKYTAVILSVRLDETIPDNNFLEVEYDIADGPLVGFYSKMKERFGRAYNTQRIYCGPRAISFFKTFITAIEQSNDDYEWDWNEQTLVGKKVGIILNSEEYEQNNGRIGTRYRIVKWVGIPFLANEKDPVPVTLNKPTAHTEFNKGLNESVWTNAMDHFEFQTPEDGPEDGPEKLPY